MAERSWGLRWSRSGVALWHRRETFGAKPVAARGSGGRGGWAAAGAVGLASIAVTAVGVVAGPVAPPSPTPLVSVAIPPAKPLVRRTRAEPPAAAAAPKPAIVAATAEAPPAITPTESDAETTDAAPIGSQAGAVDAAVRSGRMRSWVDTETGAQGFVVVGDAVEEGGRTCREVSILIKGDGDSKVSRDRRCVPT